MWTICWTDNEGNHWERFSDKWDIINFSNTLVREGDIAEEDIFIFSPKAEQFLVPYNNLEQ